MVMLGFNFCISVASSHPTHSHPLWIRVLPPDTPHCLCHPLHCQAICFFLSLATLLLFSSLHDEDLAFLEDDNSDDDDFDDFANFNHSSEEAYNEPKVDDKDIIILKEHNFTTVVENNLFVMVEIYAP